MGTFTAPLTGSTLATVGGLIVMLVFTVVWSTVADTLATFAAVPIEKLDGAAPLFIIESLMVPGVAVKCTEELRFR